MIASRRVADFWRAAKGTPPPLDGDDLQGLAEALVGELPQGLVDTRCDIVVALSRLTAEQREALAWRYMAQVTVTETAVFPVFIIVRADPDVRRIRDNGQVNICPSHGSSL